MQEHVKGGQASGVTTATKRRGRAVQGGEGKRRRKGVHGGNSDGLPT